MPGASRTELITTTQDFVDDHDCSYAERLLRVETSQRTGSYGIALAVLSGHVTELVKLHNDNSCPPTHINNGPTSEWADWVQDTAA